ncbi:RAQPRD family integrative conjugative element protein [Pseudomonas bijieensis]|uniref:integrative conjugative element protein, RAQPRD family n=1 Tax=Pseudomonas bijieensis TaxID=2681983 RepID=UPI00200BA80B|nr:RAQPRD family integrative conjugative element protein [Pseudomonas bijieensis]UQI28517.1 RAQPRD family integrative conjugative element protein [Pseudomonas bijieensis]
MINPVHRKHLRKLFFLLAFVGKATATANEIVDEHTRLSIVLRELNAIERLAAAGDLANIPASSRYHFNYGYLRADIARVSVGIRAYLSPQRATPREVVLLQGSYIDETAPAP